MSITKNIYWNVFGNFVPLLVGFVSVPYLIKNSSVEIVGILTIIWGIIGYLSLFDFGLGRVITRKISLILNGDSLHEVRLIAKSGLKFTLWMGFFGGGILLLLSNNIAYSWLNVSEVYKRDVYYSLIISALCIPITTATVALKGVLEGFEEFKIVNLLRMILGATNFGLPAVSLTIHGDSIAWMTFYLFVSRFFMFFIHFIFVNKLIKKKWLFEKSDKKIGEFFVSGFWMTISNLILPLGAVADKFVISSVLGASAIAFFTVPSEILTRVLIFPVALTGALFPRIAYVYSINKSEAKKIYQKYLKISTVLMSILLMILLIFSQIGLSIWLGKEFSEKAWAIFCILSVGIFFNGIAQIPFATIQAVGMAKRAAMLHIIEFVIYVPLLYASLNFLGLIGGAIVWSTKMFVDLIGLLIINRNLNYNEIKEYPN